MKILNISTNDYANFAHDNANALRSVGHHVYDVTLSHHIFGYGSCSKVIQFVDIQRYVEWADVVQVFHSETGLGKILRKYRKPTIVYHTGSRYRLNPDDVHDVYDGWVKLHVCALPELYKAFKSRSTEPVTYIVGAIDVPKVVSFENYNPIRVGHFPSNPSVKGTHIIDGIFQRLISDGFPAEFDIRTDQVEHDRQMMRYMDVDVYIEMMATSQQGKEYGSFGITALEAASRGKAVITNCGHRDIYQEFYGQPVPFVVVDNEREMEAAIATLIEYEPQRLTDLKKELHASVLNTHSYKPSGKYINDNILSRIR